jgi:hypothetical protein
LTASGRVAGVARGWPPGRLGLAGPHGRWVAARLRLPPCCMGVGGLIGVRARLRGAAVRLQLPGRLRLPPGRTPPGIARVLDRD